MKRMMKYSYPFTSNALMLARTCLSLACLSRSTTGSARADRRIYVAGILIP